MIDDSKTDEAQPVEPGPTPEQIREFMAKSILAELAGLAAMFGLQTTEQEITVIANFLLDEQQMIVQKVLPSMVDPEQVKKAPVLGLRVWHKSDKQKSQMISFLTYKQPKLVGVDPRSPVDFAAVLAVLLSPAVRGILALYGFRWELLQVKAEENRIIR